MARKALMYGIQLVHQSPPYVKLYKTEPLWLCPVTPTEPGERPVTHWSPLTHIARKFKTRKEAAAAQPDPWLVTTKVERI